MQITILFSSKDKQNAICRDDITQMISDCIFEASEHDDCSLQLVADCEVKIISRDKSVSLIFSVISFEKMCELIVMTSKEDALSFKAMELFYKCLRIPKYQKKYNYTLAYDGPSQILCKRLYKPISEFERKLRRLIYGIVIMAYGGSWYKETIDGISNQGCDRERLKNDMKKKSGQEKINLIENALEEMDYHEIIVYLFTPYSYMSYDELFTDKITKESMSQLTRDELVNRINEVRPKSLWDRLFGEIDDLKDFKLRLDYIRKIRNKIMHSKKITYDEYRLWNKVLRELIILINQAIDESEKADYSSLCDVDIIQAISILHDCCNEATRLVQQAVDIDFNSCISSVIDSISVASKNLSKGIVVPFLRNYTMISNSDHDELDVLEDI